MVYEYYNLIFFFFLVMFLCFLLFNLNNILVMEEPDTEKNSSYECGFQPFDLELQQFEVKYYVVALLFLIFDIEIIFLIPFINIIDKISLFTFLNFFFFLNLLFLGLVYEWKKKSFDWE